MRIFSKTACLLLFFSHLAVETPAQQEIRSAKKIESLLRKTSSEVADACIKLVIRDTVADRDFGGFSGVIVSSDGTILTAAHSVQPNHRYRVEFPDGQKGIATALGKIALDAENKQFDLAMLKMEGKGSWPFVMMADNRALILGEGCLAISYPGSFFQTKPNLRFGRLTNLDAGDGLIESTCKMEPGDSGGALFDLQGKLIGIRDKIQVNEDENFDIPVNLFRQYWSALQKPVNYRRLPAAEPLPPVMENKRFTVASPAHFSQFGLKFTNQVTTLHSTKGNAQQQIQATEISMEQKGRQQILWLSKSSMLGEQPWMMYNGAKIQLNVISRDPDNDLVLLSAPDSINNFHGLKLGKVKYKPLSPVDLGRFLYSPISPEDCKTGIISTGEIKLPLLFSRAQLGALVFEEAGKMMVKDIAQNYPAEQVLKIGDQIISINGKVIPNEQVYQQEMNGLVMGDHLTLGIIRNHKTSIVDLDFKERPTRDIAQRYKGKRSLRSDGFEKVFVQDAAIRSDECGGPVFDRNGNFMGINIARHSRTATIILPLDVIQKSIAKMMDSAKS
ncbi:trypsin-like peptidase domain-containing protein [uncultured Pedobacter sp.]|uniref:trypsin-like peptidase domain-containing protein n=1 Tax=uncultured Pedobacter sp. TaxID=246139 RepID=UPI0025FD4241|nr:trypsin-like peptidase domain-containing protein [uncultured Pedobacter sp.]